VSFDLAYKNTLATCIIISVLLCQPWNSFGQRKNHPYWTDYGIADGLPSNNIICAYTDSQGLLWFGTEIGLCSFDGTKFETHSNSTIVAIAEGPDHAIWFATQNGSVYRLTNDSVVLKTGHIDINDHLIFNQTLYKIDVISEDSVYVSSKNGYALLCPDTLVEQIANMTGDGHTIEKKHRAYLSRQRLKRKTRGVVSFAFRERDYSIDLNAFFPPTALPTDFNFNYEYAHERMVVSIDSIVFSITEGRVDTLYLHSNSTNSISILSDTSFLIGTENSGAYLYSNGSWKTRYFEDDHISSFSTDFEGGYWFGTQGKGIRYIPSLHFETLIPEHKTDIIGIHNTGGKTCFLDKDFDLWHGKTKIAHRDLPSSKPSYLFSRVSLDENSYEYSIRMESGSRSRISWNFTQNSIAENKKIALASSLSAMIHRGDTLRGTYTRILINEKSCKSKQYRRIRDIIEDPNNGKIVWAASSKGILKLKHFDDQDTITVLNRFNIDLSFQRLVWFKENLIAFSSGKPLFMYLDEEQDFVPHHGPEISKINKIMLHKNILYLGTVVGLFKLEFIDDLLSAENLNDLWGLPPFEVIDLDINEDTLLIASRKQIFKTSVSNATNIGEEPGKVKLKRIIVNGKAHYSTTGHEIFIEDNIRFNFQLIDFKKTSIGQFQYRLLPIDTNWLDMSATDLSFHQLRAGLYQLEVKNQANEVHSTSFEIKNKFYQRIWFQVAASILFLLVLLVPLYLRSRFALERARFQNQQNASRMTALTSQLKPHFIFNSLSSIQAFILTNDKRSSSEYLAKFARHIRNVLEQSQEQQTSLDKLLKSTFDYLVLEQLRSSPRFEFNIHIDNNIINSHIDVPVMLIQPYVENAVLHGISGIDRTGFIEISVSRPATDVLEFVIKDNGRGFTNGGTNSGLGIGTRINKERLDLLTHLNEGRFTIDFEHNLPHGTIITITWDKS